MRPGSVTLACRAREDELLVEACLDRVRRELHRDAPAIVVRPRMATLPLLGRPTREIAPRPFVEPRHVPAPTPAPAASAPPRARRAPRWALVGISFAVGVAGGIALMLAAHGPLQRIVAVTMQHATDARIAATSAF